MSVTATITEDWLLVEDDSQLRTQKRREVDMAAGLVKGWLEQADVSSLSIKCHFVGLTAFTKEVGTELSGLSYEIGAGVSLTFSTTGGAKYICTRDKVQIDDHIDGEGWEHQTWERVSKWEIVADSYYEEALPAEGTIYDQVPDPDPPE
jgi:hypothetical protein